MTSAGNGLPSSCPQGCSAFEDPWLFILPLACIEAWGKEESLTQEKEF